MAEAPTRDLRLGHYLLPGLSGTAMLAYRCAACVSVRLDSRKALSTDGMPNSYISRWGLGRYAVCDYSDDGCAGEVRNPLSRGLGSEYSYGFPKGSECKSPRAKTLLVSEVK